MRLFLLFFSLLIIFCGCTETPEISTSKTTLAQDQIEINKSEAQKAQEEYLELQQQRNRE